MKTRFDLFWFLPKGKTNQNVGVFKPEEAFLINLPPPGGGYSIKVHTGRLRPVVKKVSLLYTFHCQMVPLLHT